MVHVGANEPLLALVLPCKCIYILFLHNFWCFCIFIHVICIQSYAHVYILYIEYSLENRELWIQIPPEQFVFLWKRVVSGVVVLCCIVLSGWSSREG